MCSKARLASSGSAPGIEKALTRTAGARTRSQTAISGGRRSTRRAGRPAAERDQGGDGDHPHHQESPDHPRLGIRRYGREEDAGRDQGRRPGAGDPAGREGGPARRGGDPAEGERGGGEQGRHPEEKGGPGGEEEHRRTPDRPDAEQLTTVELLGQEQAEPEGGTRRGEETGRLAGKGQAPPPSWSGRGPPWAVRRLSATRSTGAIRAAARRRRRGPRPATAPTATQAAASQAAFMARAPEERRGGAGPASQASTATATGAIAITPAAAGSGSLPPRSSQADTHRHRGDRHAGGEVGEIASEEEAKHAAEEDEGDREERSLDGHDRADWHVEADPRPRHQGDGAARDPHAAGPEESLVSAHRAERIEPVTGSPPRSRPPRPAGRATAAAAPAPRTTSTAPPPPYTAAAGASPRATAMQAASTARRRSTSTATAPAAKAMRSRRGWFTGSGR